MAWTLDKSHADFRRWDILNEREQRNWDSFQNAIRNKGAHPRTAAEQLGTVGGRANADYKCLGGDQYQIRLSKDHRATFRVMPAGQGGTVFVLQVGGHT
ncbi:MULTISPECIES: hypothetical protein [Sorangium]|uniref:hypothetical protein n=1 Tax=Sorangium TaxID=39643 RepID=UPI003D9C337E